MSTVSPGPSRLPEPWTPVRYLRTPQVCHLCFHRIPAHAPGSTSGSRGTHCFFLPKALLRDVDGRRLLGPGLFECVRCKLDNPALP